MKTACQIEFILDGYQSVDLFTRGTAYRQIEWTTFDSEAADYTLERSNSRAGDLHGHNDALRR